MPRFPQRPAWRPWPTALLALVCVAAWTAHGRDEGDAKEDNLPPAPTYIGDIRRDTDGKLKAFPPAEEKTVAATGNSARELPGDANRRILRVGPGEKIATVTEAAKLARDGDIVDIAPGEYRRQPAIWTQDKLTIRGQGHPVMIADGASAEDKAIWVVKGGAIRIEDIEFRGARVPEGNGAGIRFEKGQLTIERCGFFDNEMGILTANSPALTLEIRDSQFGQAPKYDGTLHHLLYVGRIGKLTLTGSRFQQGYRGHLVKSRARENHVFYNLLYDGPQGQASYELEFPEGGLAYVVGNIIEQSERTDNPAIVAYGAEGGSWPENGLYLAHNTLINDYSSGSFLKTWLDKLPADTEIWAINNLTVGYGLLPTPPRGRFEGNQNVARGTLTNHGGLPIKLTAQSPLRGMARLPGRARDIDLMPTAEFTFPAGTRPIQPGSVVTAGAYQ